MASETIVSAPGKVLLTGGYLVLERANPGLVLSLSARFYVRLIEESKSDEKDAEISSSSGRISFRIVSQQFRYDQRFWFVDHQSESEATTIGDRFEMISQNPATYRPNTFVELAIFYSLVAAALESKIPNSVGALTLQIYADNSFYSQIDQLKSRNLDTSLTSHESLAYFLPPLDGHEIYKNGLGSSAALVTSVSGSILTHFGLLNKSDNLSAGFSDAEEVERLHRLAQFIHCQAQGKIGSGFDVSSAVYGSQKYIRFSPGLLNDLLHKPSTTLDPAGAGNRVPSPVPITLLKSFLQLFKSAEVDGSSSSSTRIPAVPWDHTHTSFALPPGFRLLMADIAQGSATPGMVANVLRWRKEACGGANPNPADSAVWSGLQLTNDRIEQHFRDLNAEIVSHGAQWTVAVQKLLSDSPASWTNDEVSISSDEDPIVASLLRRVVELRRDFRHARKLLKEMGERAGALAGQSVDIEPDAQTRLADASMAIPGVLSSGVPGAGGFDAIFAICLDASVVPAVEKTWLQYEAQHVAVLPIREDASGLRVESVVPVNANAVA